MRKYSSEFSYFAGVRLKRGRLSAVSTHTIPIHLVSLSMYSGIAAESTPGNPVAQTKLRFPVSNSPRRRLSRRASAPQSNDLHSMISPSGHWLQTKFTRFLPSGLYFPEH